MLNPPPAAEDPALLRAERGLRLLEELAEIGLELARTLRPGAAASEAADAGVDAATVNPTGRLKGRDPAEVFAPLSRAIRLTLALEARTDADFRDLKAGVTRAREKGQARAAERARKAAANDREARIDRIRDLVLTVAEIEVKDRDAYDDITDCLDDHLSIHEDEFARPERLLRETIERLCRELSLNPDWSRRTGEGWAVDDAPDRPRVSALDGPHVEPVLDGAHRPPEAQSQPGSRQLAHDLE